MQSQPIRPTSFRYSNTLAALRLPALFLLSLAIGCLASR
ncbi:putative membrane protein [Collimonas fungivorans]|uniref:Putative membrane protein n=1 Tax=Collimonas fungivorans TaxID=158899 RepID=A0A127PAC2_9BURK|nr:putative membrane protein [Collimonas fungivorans]